MKSIFTFLILLISLKAMTQISGKYNFSHRIENYQTVGPDAIDLVEDIVWDDEFLFIQLGFTMNFFGKPTEFLLGNTYGLTFHPDDTLYDIPETMMILNADFADLAYNAMNGVPESPIYLHTIGNPGERVTILEYNNAGFYSDNPDLKDFVNFQFKFFEKDHSMEMHFGPSKITNIRDIFDLVPGPLVGLVYKLYIDEDDEEVFLDTTLLVRGDSNQFNAIQSDRRTRVENPLIYFRGWPKENQVFRFAPQVVSANTDLSHTGLKVFPNPYHEKFIVQSQEPISDLESLQLKNSLGQNIRFEAYKISDRTIEIKTDAQLPSGIYRLTMSSQNGSMSKSVLKH